MSKQNKKAYQTKTRIFKNAGYFVLTKRLADGTVSKNPEDIYTSDTAIVQSITTKYSTTSEKMENGNSFFPAAEHVTGVEATAEVVLNTFDPKLWEFAAGAKTATVENGDTAVENGSSATWSEGENTLTVTVTNGSAIKNYTVTVTKE